MAEATARVYSECLTASSATQSNPAQKIIVSISISISISKKRLLAAAKHSLQTTISPKNRNVLFSRSLLHFALRLRYTGLGIWLYRIVPLHWQKKLKTFLLA
jgi:hypothetical protein